MCYTLTNDFGQHALEVLWLLTFCIHAMSKIPLYTNCELFAESSCLPFEHLTYIRQSNFFLYMLCFFSSTTLLRGVVCNNESGFGSALLDNGDFNDPCYFR